MNRNTQKMTNTMCTRGDFNMTDAGAGFLFGVLCLLGFQLLLGFVWGIGIRASGWPEITEVQSTSFLFLILTSLALQAVLCLFYWLYTKKRGIRPFEAPRVKNMPARNWLLSAAAAVAALFGLMFTSFAFDLLFVDVFKYKTPDMPGFNTWGRAVSGVAVMGILPAVFEELIFRGMVLRGLKGLGKRKAVLISAAAFSLSHMSPSQTVHQFLLGVIMGLIAWETGSLLGPMLIHFINNALAVILEFSGFFGFLEGMPPWQIIVIALVTFCAVCGIIYVILRCVKKPDGSGGAPPAGETAIKSRIMDEKHALVFLLSGFCVTALVWAVTLFSGLST